MPIVAVPDAIPVADLDEGETPELSDERLPLGASEAQPKHDRAPTASDAIGATIASLAKRGFRRLLVDDRAVNLEEVDRAALAGRTTLAGHRRPLADRWRPPDAPHRLDRDRLCRGRRRRVRARNRARGARPLARHVFSERFECRRCGIAYEDPQPRLFSFNNPFGACATCHGFGNVIELDIDLVVPDGRSPSGRARSSHGPSPTTGRSSRT